MDNFEDDEFAVFRVRFFVAIFIAMLPLGVMLIFAW